MNRVWTYLEQQHPQLYPLLRRDLEPFERNLAQYHELIEDSAGNSVGLLTQGEGPAFTQRVRTQLERLHPAPSVLAHFDAQSAWMEHTRTFVKLEWRAEQPHPRVSWYHRRRPTLQAGLDFFRSRLTSASLLAIERLAQHLDKTSIHFVAGHQPPGQPAAFKVYFSQAFSETRAEQLSTRLEHALTEGGLSPAVQRLWHQWHHLWQQQQRDGTLFVSLELTEAGPLPGLKLDYPHIPPEAVALLAPFELKQPWCARAKAMALALGRKRLSHLGLRLRGEHVAVRFYVEGATRSYE